MIDPTQQIRSGLTPLRPRAPRPVPGQMPGPNTPAMPLPPSAPDPNAPLEIGDTKPLPGTVPPPAGGVNTFGGAPGGGRGQGMQAWSGYQGMGAMPAMPSFAAPSGGGSGGFPLGGASTGGFAASTAYGPGTDLRNQQIGPSESASTQAATGAAQNALSSYAGWQANPWQSVGGSTYNPAADTTGLRSSLSQAIASLQNGPDRGQLAAQNFNLLDQTAAEATARDARTLGQDASKFGRIGAGMTTTNLGDLGERQALARSRAQSQMSLDAAGQTMGDRLNIAGAIGSGFNTLSGADRADSNQSLALRNEARGERDASNAYNAADFSRRGQLFGDAATYQQGERNYDASRRDELRGERGYQNGMEQTAYDRNRQAIGDANTQQQQALNQAFGLLGAGSGADMSGLLGGMGASQSANAAGGWGDLASLFAQYARNRTQ